MDTLKLFGMLFSIRCILVYNMTDHNHIKIRQTMLCPHHVNIDGDCFLLQNTINSTSVNCHIMREDASALSLNLKRWHKTSSVNELTYIISSIT